MYKENFINKDKLCIVMEYCDGGNNKLSNKL